MAVEDYDTIFNADDIPVSDDQIRATARIPYSDTAQVLMHAVESLPLSFEYKLALNTYIAANLSKDAVFAHNQSVSQVLRTSDIGMIATDFSKSPKDAECMQLPSLLRDIHKIIGDRASRTIGGKQIDERTRQYNPTQRIEQVQRMESAPIPKEAQDEGGL